MAGRPRAFDRDTALAVAMERFWRDGYDATTVSRLTAEMGITPPSLYAAFGDKDQLFDAAAACYFDSVSSATAGALDTPTAFEGIANVLRMTAAAHTDPETPPGCFMLAEPRLADRRALLRDQIAERIQRGIAEGDLPADASADALADFVMAVLGGMSTRARDGGTRAEVEAIVTTALTAMPRPAAS
jgi:AcrR family transcriptional regulator